MVDQTQVNTPDQSASRPANRGTAAFLHDVLTLVELQCKLLAIDSRQWLNRLLWPVLGLAAAAALAASCLPLALVVLALVLVETTPLSHAQAFGTALCVGLALVVVFLVAAIWYVRHRLGFLERSRQQWTQNLQWAKETLQRARHS